MGEVLLLASCVHLALLVTCGLRRDGKVTFESAEVGGQLSTML